ncbi:hypothetical protein DKY63_06360 [Pseudomonas putida]|uniref:Uncharacterized protein n=1 Tax=Pseudomonas putida TaxID=303 RepID=A0A2Z4RF05_PSEPU|nr:hypothetical protein [Pseudomonas putida]AWY39546.1 hypothetical protein DKY63_06360 [Pseudomonas putida]
MLSISRNFFIPTDPFKLIKTTPHDGTQPRLFVEQNKILYSLEKTHNTSGPKLELKIPTNLEIESFGKTSFNFIQYNPTEILKNPGLVLTSLAQYTYNSSPSNRFPSLEGLSEIERSQYKQIANMPTTEALRRNLLSLVDEDIRDPFSTIINEWVTFGVSVSEIDVRIFKAFSTYFDAAMDAHAIKKGDYTKLDFAAQNIQALITDPRCIEANLTSLQIFKAAFQLGAIPAVSNLRLMINLAGEAYSKFREWLIHFDNSNYDAEFKLITTWVLGTCLANEEQCLAAFPYDTSQSIRFTKSEAATKFPTLEDLENEFRGIPGASYIVIQNPNNDTPLETGIRTEMIAHHRSANSKDGQEKGESRGSRLMTFHGLDRCKPFLTGAELKQANHLTPLQNFVLGGFRNVNPEKFMEYMKAEKQPLNEQIRGLIGNRRVIPLEKLTVARFNGTDTTVINKPLFNKQMGTYENLPEIIELIPNLADESNWQKETILKMVPMLMNYDQNAELKPDCSENEAFPARTQLRERTNEAFFRPLERDLSQVRFDTEQQLLLPLEKIVDIAQHIHDFYSHYTTRLKDIQQDHPMTGLFESRAALAKEYTEQFRSRATLPETHQTLTLFTYYMLDDLDLASQTLSNSKIKIDDVALESIKKEKTSVLQHFITHRILSDRNKD